MDSWTEKQIKMMFMGGNARCNSFLAQHGVSSATHSIAQKYNSPPAQLYRERYVILWSCPLDFSPTDSWRWSRGGSSRQNFLVLRSSTAPEASSRVQIHCLGNQKVNMWRDRELSKSRSPPTTSLTSPDLPQARERMRQKFGNSSGLSSSGS
jgi:hypothetical protein